LFAVFGLIRKSAKKYIKRIKFFWKIA